MKKSNCNSDYICDDKYAYIFFVNSKFISLRFKFEYNDEKKTESLSNEIID